MIAGNAPIPAAPETPETLATRLVRDAESYRLAALRVHPKDDPDAKPRLLARAWFLLCHSAELSLKAYLLCHGVANDRKTGGLKNQALRHNLSGLYAEAVAIGFAPPNDEFSNQVELLAPYHEAHAFRYRKTGWVSLSEPRHIASVLKPVIADIALTVRRRWQATQGASAT